MVDFIIESHMASVTAPSSVYYNTPNFSVYIKIIENDRKTHITSECRTFYIQ